MPVSTIGGAAVDTVNFNGTGASQLPVGTTAQRPASPQNGMMRFNTTTNSGEAWTTATGWTTVFSAPLGTQTNPADSGPALLSALGAGAGDGIYWFRNSSGLTQQLFCDLSAGGWVLVASNNANDSSIAGGTGRYSSGFFLNRGGLGVLGTASPNGDYIIGSFLDNFTFSQARVVAFGRGSTNNTTSYAAASRGTWVEATWPLSTTGVARYSQVVPRSSVTVGGNNSLSSLAAFFVLDGILVDFQQGGFTANANQITIGGVGVSGSSGDPTTGCYLGHGNSEGSFEGWYDAANAAADSQGYTTWVR
jgi:hypothetical protein